MRFRLHPGILIALVVVLCLGVITGLVLLRWRSRISTAGLMDRLPPGDAAILFLDLQALRRSGVLEALTAAKVAEEPEYRAFVLETGFDYRQDLDSALVAFQSNNVYFLLRGRFNWRRLNSYVAGLGGQCRNTFCRVGGSTPQRNISFFPLSSDLMALAVSADTWAASELMSRKPTATPVPVPDQPLWLLAPASLLKDNGKLPAGTRLFAKAMEGARRIVLSMGPRNGRFEAVLDVTCRSAKDADLLSLQLEGTTELLRSLLAKENKTPNPRDLSGVLAAGTFEHSDTHVVGRWPVERAFLEALAGGSL